MSCTFTIFDEAVTKYAEASWSFHRSIFFSSENKEQKIDINIKNFGSDEAFFEESS